MRMEMMRLSTEDEERRKVEMEKERKYHQNKKSKG